MDIAYHTCTIRGPRQRQRGMSMKYSVNLAWVTALIAAVILAGGIFLLSSGTGSEAPTDSPENELRHYAAGGLEIAIATEPAIPRVGSNRLIVEVREANGDLISVDIDAYAEMPAMGSMQAMRAPADLKETATGRYEGAVNLLMRGEWPLTMTIRTPQDQSLRLMFDLATDRAEMPIAAGGTAIGGAALMTDDSDVIVIDNRRRQMIGVETGEATHRNLVKSIRAVGEVTFDETSFSQITLKYDGYIGDLRADYVGAAVAKGQVLFTVYSPELLSAQREYLETLKRRSNPGFGTGMLQAAQRRLALWDMSAQEINALEQRGVPQDYVAIYAPRNGTLIERHISDGSAAHKGQTLLTIADLSRVWIEAEVFEADLDLARVGMAALVTLPYLPGRSYPAVVEYVYPYLDSDSRTGRIRLSLDNQNGELKPGMYAEVSLKAELGHLLSVPEEAIIIAGSTRIVFIDLGNGRLKPVRITTGRRVQGYVEVLTGLALGDSVVTSGNFLIAAETRLKMGLEQW